MNDGPKEENGPCVSGAALFIATDDVCRERRRRKFANVGPFPPHGRLALEETQTTNPKRREAATRDE